MEDAACCHGLVYDRSGCKLRFTSEERCFGCLAASTALLSAGSVMSQEMDSHPTPSAMPFLCLCPSKHSHCWPWSWAGQPGGTGQPFWWAGDPTSPWTGTHGWSQLPPPYTLLFIPLCSSALSSLHRKRKAEGRGEAGLRTPASRNSFELGTKTSRRNACLGLFTRPFQRKL